MIEFDNEKHEYKVEGKVIPSVTQIIYDIFPFKFGNDFAMKKGKNGHHILEIWDKEYKDISDVFTKLYLAAWQKFLDDFQIKFQPDWIEMPLYSKTWGFAGTLDRLGDINEKLTIIDIKIGQNSKTYALQTIAYSLLVEENLKIKVKNRWLVILNNKGKYSIIEHKNQTDKTAFLSCFNLFKWKHK